MIKTRHFDFIPRQMTRVFSDDPGVRGSVIPQTLLQSPTEPRLFAVGLETHRKRHELTNTPLKNALKSLVLVAIFGLSLTGCGKAIREADASISNINSLTRLQQRQLKAAQRGDIIFEPLPYYGEEIIAERGSRNGKPLPKNLEGARGFTANLVKSTHIAAIARLITDQTDLPVNIRRRYIRPGGQIIEILIGGRFKAKYQGSLSKFLDRVASRLDVGWSYDGTAITFDPMVTRTYKLPIPQNATQFTTSIGGVSGTSGANRSVSLTKTVSQDPWKEIELLLNSVVIEPATLTLSKNAGRVTVFGQPSVHKKARTIIDDYHAIYSTRIGLEIAVFFVDVEKSDDFGIGLNASKTNAKGTGALLGAAGALTGNGVLTLSRGSSSLDFKALAKNAAVVDYRLGNTIAQSGVVSPIVLTRTTNYVAKTTVTTSDAGNSAAIETASLDTGISIHALPRLIDRNQIQLSLTVLQNNLTSLDTFETAQTSVQLPVVDQRAIQNESVLAPGETLILSGYEQEVSSRNNTGTGLAKFIGLGSSSKANVQKIRMVIFVRPSIIANTRS